METFSGKIPIGFIPPQTRSLASSGIAMQQGTELAVEEINNAAFNDVRLKLIIEDKRFTTRLY